MQTLSRAAALSLAAALATTATAPCSGPCSGDLACSAGYYANGEDWFGYQDYCYECPSGRSSAGATSGTNEDDGMERMCAQCATGQYADEAGSGTCEVCPAGSVTYYQCRGDRLMECRPSDDTYYQAAGTCLDSNSEPMAEAHDSQSACTVAAGTWTQATWVAPGCPCRNEHVYGEAMEALSVADWRWSVFDAAQQRTRVPGTTLRGVHATSGANSCQLCPPGKFTSNSAVACQDCPAGYATNTGANPGASTCDACEPGQFSKSSDFECTDCLIGKFQDLPAQDRCTHCAPGTYSDVAGSDEASDCEACDAGTFTPSHADGLAVPCKACPAGKVQPGEGASGCLQCAAPAYGRDSERCHACPDGKTVNRGSDYLEHGCVACPTGEPGRWGVCLADDSGVTTEPHPACGDGICPSLPFADTSGWYTGHSTPAEQYPHLRDVCFPISLGNSDALVVTVSGFTCTSTNTASLNGEYTRHPITNLDHPYFVNNDGYSLSWNRDDDGTAGHWAIGLGKPNPETGSVDDAVAWTSSCPIGSDAASFPVGCTWIEKCDNVLLPHPSTALSGISFDVLRPQSEPAPTHVEKSHADLLLDLFSVSVSDAVLPDGAWVCDTISCRMNSLLQRTRIWLTRATDFLGQAADSNAAAIASQLCLEGEAYSDLACLGHGDGPGWQELHDLHERACKVAAVTHGQCSNGCELERLRGGSTHRIKRGGVLSSSRKFDPSQGSWFDSFVANLVAESSDLLTQTTAVAAVRQTANDILTAISYTATVQVESESDWMEYLEIQAKTQAVEYAKVVVRIDVEITYAVADLQLNTDAVIAQIELQQSQADASFDHDRDNFDGWLEFARMATTTVIQCGYAVAAKDGGAGIDCAKDIVDTALGGYAIYRASNDAECGHIDGDECALRTAQLDDMAQQLTHAQAFSDSILTLNELTDLALHHSDDTLTAALPELLEMGTELDRFTSDLESMFRGSSAVVEGDAGSDASLLVLLLQRKMAAVEVYYQSMLDYQKFQMRKEMLVDVANQIRIDGNGGTESSVDTGSDPSPEDREARIRSMCLIALQYLLEDIRSFRFEFLTSDTGAEEELLTLPEKRRSVSDYLSLLISARSAMIKKRECYRSGTCVGTQYSTLTGENCWSSLEFEPGPAAAEHFLDTGKLKVPAHMPDRMSFYNVRAIDVKVFLLGLRGDSIGTLEVASIFVEKLDSASAFHDSEGVLWEFSHANSRRISSSYKPHTCAPVSSRQAAECTSDVLSFSPYGIWAIDVTNHTRSSFDLSTITGVRMAFQLSYENFKESSDVHADDTALFKSKEGAGLSRCTDEGTGEGQAWDCHIQGTHPFPFQSFLLQPPEADLQPQPEPEPEEGVEEEEESCDGETTMLHLSFETVAMAGAACFVLGAIICGVLLCALWGCCKTSIFEAEIDRRRSISENKLSSP